jgi:hypothetical protein
MAKLINDKYFLEPGDLVEANVVTLKFVGGGDNYEISDLSDADLKVWVEEDEEDYPVKYAWDLPKSDPNYGKIYYEK